jgi:hypothetical protein
VHIWDSGDLADVWQNETGQSVSSAVLRLAGSRREVHEWMPQPKFHDCKAMTSMRGDPCITAALKILNVAPELRH